MALRVQAGRLAGGDFTAELLAREVPRTLGEIDVVERNAFGGTAKFALAPFTQVALHNRPDAAPIRARTRALTLDQRVCIYNPIHRAVTNGVGTDRHAILMKEADHFAVDHRIGLRVTAVAGA